MAGRVHLFVTGGPMKGRKYAFDEHDTFLVGRLRECHCCLLDDQQVSRRHFIIEVNPPEARIRDLGSRNGTYVNERKIGSRVRGETPEQGQKRKYPELDLKDGDTIRAGDAVFSVHIEREGSLGPVVCTQCGKDVAAEIGGRQIDAYICQVCRQNIETDPTHILRNMLALKDRKSAEKVGLPVISGFQVKRRIGNGAFGAVYLAERGADQKSVAIKIMLSRVSVDTQTRRVFTKEMTLLQELKHENIVAVYDSGSVGGAFYFVMEHCPSGSVADYMEANGGKMSPSFAMPIMLEATKGLAYAHQNNVVHRDMKPQNILLAGTPAAPIAKIADLGLAKNFEKAGFSGNTLTGTYAGTLTYMPKEQLTGYKYVKPVSDVWSLGATFYNILTGQTPRIFPQGIDPLEVILQNEVIPIGRRDSTIPVGLAAVVDKAIQANPKDRYEDAAEMLADLQIIRI